MGKFDIYAHDAFDVIEQINKNIKEYILSFVSGNANVEANPAYIEKALEGLTMPMHNVGADARVTHYCADFFERLESISCVWDSRHIRQTEIVQ